MSISVKVEINPCTHINQAAIDLINYAYNYNVSVVTEFNGVKIFVKKGDKSHYIVKYYNDQCEINKENQLSINENLREIYKALYVEAFYDSTTEETKELAKKLWPFIKGINDKIKFIKE